MFDFRYHALSLAAVLLALAVGVVIGVAIGDSDLVSSAKSGIVHDLKEEVRGEQQHAAQLSARLSGEEAFANDLYPIAVHGLLSGQSIGLVFLGSPSNSINALVRDAVTQAGGDLATVVAVREPLDLSGLGRAAEGTRYAALATVTPSSGAAAEGAGETTSTSAPTGEVPSQLIEDFGTIVAKQLVSGGQNLERELISRVRGRLLTAFDGQLGKLQGVVIVRDDPNTQTPEQSKASAAFEKGFVSGVEAVGTPIVGAELSSAEPSQIPWYQGKDVSSVDDLDATAGQAALIYALAGSHGAYGTKSTADSLLPNVVGSTTTTP
ncbi:MAG: copper transporter [Solirubrobacteraceae bacterium]